MRLAGAVAPLLLAGCVQATLPKVEPGGTPPKGMAILMGEIRIIPPVVQNEPGARGALILGDMNGNFLATFSGTLKEEFSRTSWPPIQSAQTAWVPMEGPFFVEVPSGHPVYLRGLTAVTNVGRADVELPVRIDLRPGDQVVYVGHLIFNRIPPEKVLVKDRSDQMRQDAKAAGHGGLLTSKWVTRLAVPVDEDGEAPSRDRGDQTL